MKRLFAIGSLALCATARLASASPASDTIATDARPINATAAASGFAPRTQELAIANHDARRIVIELAVVKPGTIEAAPTRTGAAFGGRG